MTIQEELEIVEKAKKDLVAFQTIYDYYFSKIFAYTINRVVNFQTAEDITSKVFLQAVENIRKFNTSKGVRFGSWLYRVAHNEIVDYYKKNKKQHEVTLKDFDGENNEEIENQVTLEEHKKMVTGILANIKPRYAQVITLKFYSQLDNGEISEVMGLKVSQVAVVLHRALKIFKKKFEKKYPKSEIFENL